MALHRAGLTDRKEQGWTGQHGPARRQALLSKGCVMLPVVGIGGSHKGGRVDR